MSVFGNYARYYDLLYKDKDYEGEVSYIIGLIKRFGNDTKTILELGCGTGKHAVLLSSKGFDVHGVDMSEQMLESANKRKSNLKEAQVAKLQFSLGDVCNIKLHKKFDAIISLFHVVSYQNTDEQFNKIFATAKGHIKPGGIFAFDVWHGPAVLYDPPVVREKRLENVEIEVTRIAKPVIHSETNIVDVNYSIFVKDKKTDKIEEIKETHNMRYFFAPEIEKTAKKHGFEMIHGEEWLTSNKPSEKTWGVCYVAKKR